MPGPAAHSQADPDGGGRFTVLVDEDEPRLLDVPRTAQAIGLLYPELTPIDVRTRCRYAAGIVDDRVPRGHAEALVQALTEAGIAARAVPAADVPRLEPPVRVAWLDLAPDVLGLRLGASLARAADAGAEVWLPWEAIDLVLLFGLDRPREREQPLTADEAAARRADEDTPLGPDAERLHYTLTRRKRRERRDATLGIDVACGGRVYRIVRGEFAWPEAHADHSLEVYLYLGRRLLAQAERAASPAGNGLLLDGLLDAALFSHEEELRRYERWLLATRVAAAG